MLSESKTKEIHQRYNNGEVLKDLLIEFKTNHHEYSLSADEYLHESGKIERNIYEVGKLEKKLFEIAHKLNCDYISTFEKAKLQAQFDTLKFAYARANVKDTHMGIPNY